MNDINSNLFEQLLNSPGYTALVFKAFWCKPCSFMTPIFDKIDHENQFINIYKVDVDLNKDIVQMYGIRSIPTVLVLKDGQKIDQFTGSYTEQEVLEKFKKMCI